MPAQASRAPPRLISSHTSVSVRCHGTLSSRTRRPCSNGPSSQQRRGAVMVRPLKACPVIKHPAHRELEIVCKHFWRIRTDMCTDHVLVFDDAGWDGSRLQVPAGPAASPAAPRRPQLSTVRELPASAALPGGSTPAEDFFMARGCRRAVVEGRRRRRTQRQQALWHRAVPGGRHLSLSKRCTCTIDDALEVCDSQPSSGLVVRTLIYYIQGIGTLVRYRYVLLKLFQDCMHFANVGFCGAIHAGAHGGHKSQGG